jgi:hypothetical protein
MDAKLRQQTIFLSQWEAFLPWGLFDKTTLQIVPKKDYYMCASKLQVIVVIYKSSLSVLCLTVILTVIL